MKREQIIQMARDAGLGSSLMPFEAIDCNGGVWMDGDHNYIEELERFAFAIRSAVKDEDAKICEQEPERQRGDGVWSCDQKACAEAIRASKWLSGITCGN